MQLTRAAYRPAADAAPVSGAIARPSNGSRTPGQPRPKTAPDTRHSRTVFAFRDALPLLDCSLRAGPGCGCSRCLVA
jgi:hypothetical protein